MIKVDEATLDDIGDLVPLESALFNEDAATHDPFSDPTWPHREGRRDFEVLIASPESVVLVARSSTEPVGLLVGYAAQSSPTRLPGSGSPFFARCSSLRLRDARAQQRCLPTASCPGPVTKGASRLTSITTLPTGTQDCSTIGSASASEASPACSCSEPPPTRSAQTARNLRCLVPPMLGYAGLA